MRAAWTVPLGIAAVVGALAFMGARYAVCSRPAPPDSPLGDLRALTRSLKLTPDQAESVKVLQDQYAAQLTGCGATQCLARRRLVEALAEETGSPERTDGLISELGRAYEQTERLTLAHLRAVRALLNEEQRTRLYVLMMRCNCSSCMSQDCGSATHREERR